MRKNSAQTGQIVDFIYATADSTAITEVIGTPSAHQIGNGEVQVVNAKSPILATGTADQIQIVQGTPNSNALVNVDPFGTGYPDLEKSGILKKGNVLSVAKYEYAPASYQIIDLDISSVTVSNYTEANGWPIYQTVFTMQSTRGDITYGMNKEVFSIQYNEATATTADFANKFVLEANKFSKLAGQGGTKPFVVLGLAAATDGVDDIGTYSVNDPITFAEYDGTAVSFTIDKHWLNSLNIALGEKPALSSFKVVNPASTDVTRILIVALDETPVLAFDDIMEVKTRIDVGISDGNVDGDMSYVKTEVTPAFEGTGLGRQVLLWYRSKAKLQKFNMQNHPIHGEFFINQDLPEYFTEDGKYSLTIIDYIDTVDTINGTSTHPKQVVIVHDATETVGADADAGVTVNTPGTTAFKADLSNFMVASKLVRDITFINCDETTPTWG